MNLILYQGLLLQHATDFCGRGYLQSFSVVFLVGCKLTSVDNLTESNFLAEHADL